MGFTFLVPAHPGSPGQMAIKQMCVRSGETRVIQKNHVQGVHIGAPGE